MSKMKKYLAQAAIRRSILPEHKIAQAAAYDVVPAAEVHERPNPHGYPHLAAVH